MSLPTWKSADGISRSSEVERMNDCISRQAVIDLISKFILEIHTEGGRDLNAHTNAVLRQILRNVKSDRVLSPVTPQEPKTGHWIYRDGECIYFNLYSCSECGVLCGTPTYNYCPNCGCGMQEIVKTCEKENE